MNEIEKRTVGRERLTSWADGLTDSEVETIQNAVIDWPDEVWTAWLSMRNRLEGRYGALDKHVLDFGSFAALAKTGPFARSTRTAGAEKDGETR